jgi:hypothetical protein
MIANQETGARVDEVAAGIYRICTPLDIIPGGFTFNSYLVADDEPLLFHTGYRKIFPITLEAIRKVMPVEKLRWIGGSHFEGDEFGALNEFLTAALEATPFGSEIGVLTSLNDFAARPARGFGEGEEFSIGSHRDAKMEILAEICSVRVFQFRQCRLMGMALQFPNWTGGSQKRNKGGER